LDIKFLFFYRDAAGRDNVVEQPGQNADYLRNSTNVGQRTKETITNDVGDVTADSDSEPRENKQHDSTADHSLHDHSYSYNEQVHKRKRNRPRVTGNNQSSDSGLSHTNRELAENHSVADDEPSTNVAKVKNKKRSVDKVLCELCGWICGKSVSLEAHMRTHAVMNSIDCDVSVSIDTKTESTLAVPQMSKCRNIQQEENKKSEDDIIAVCDLCGWVRKKSNRKRTLKEHMMLKHSSERPFKCRHCSQTFKVKPNLQRHEILHDDVRKFLCQYCARSFQQKASLVCHISRHHADMMDSDANRRQFSCRFCGEKFDITSHVRQHIQNMHRSAFCLSAKLQKQTLTRVRASGDVRPRPFGCNICDVDFVFARTLERHIIDHGTGITGSAYKCQLCSEQFETVIALESHVLEVHSIAGPKYQCTECNRLFKIESQLKQHMRVHTANAITCTVCGMKFVFQSELKYHMVKHTGSSGQTAEKFGCSVCGKHFANKCLLESHERIHSGAKPFVCSVCGKAFRHCTTLYQHRRIHSGAKPFVCSVCGKAFRQCTHLHQHRRTHTKARPYCCSFCSKTYRNRIDLRLHCTRVHNVELPLKRRCITAT